MTTTATPAAEPTAAPEVTPEQLKAAGAEVLDRVFIDVFFNKLAEHAIVPRNEKQAEQLLGIALNIEKHEQHPAVKKASAKNKVDFLDFAAGSLETKLSSMGIQPNRASAPTDDDELDKIAQAYCEHPTVQAAALAILS